jgi:hypothetical protein
MKLYHFTCADQVLPIKEHGLLPSLEPQMSPDHAVVWLTSQPDVSLTERDAKAVALWLQTYEAPLEDLRRMRAGEIETLEAGPCKRWRYGTTAERLHMVINGQERTVTFVGDADDLVRLAIDVGDDDANLHRYVTWRNRPTLRRHRTVYQLDHIRLRTPTSPASRRTPSRKSGRCPDGTKANE